MVLGDGQSEKFKEIHILKNRFEEIGNLKLRFTRSLIDIVRNKLEELALPILQKFENYVINYIPEVEIFQEEFD